ncbi:MobQ family relaxase [Thalassorhabdus alkalitolerans]|uniref:MobQ family relaxase n=1 Tax=Thalassorhabdus alkalitolerans TaxID=2282697 RepID=A0ABW0YUJ2_9BACI
MVAIYHFSGQVISRGKGQSAIAAAAYRSGENLYSERYDRANHYKRMVQPENYLLTPLHAPDWANDRERLWNEVEKVERHKRAQLAREINVALPKELSKEEQTNLTLEFCQNVFVNEGMVADLSIHRDDVNNPHFHVLLTMRSFKENGEWEAKAKKVNGQRINMNNWGDRETFRHWRKEWASYANQYLEANGMDDRITEKSYAELGKQVKPTIHEGHVARSMGEDSERVQENQKIREHNRKIVEIEEYKKEVQDIKSIPEPIRHLSPNEKKEIASLAKELKAPVTFETLNEKKEILQKWYRSEYIKKPVEERDESKLEYIRGLNEKVDHVEEILSKEADRFLEKHYPSIDQNSFSDFAKRGLVNVIIRQSYLPGHDEALEKLHYYSDREINHHLSSLSIDRTSTADQLERSFSKMDTKLNQLVQEHGIDFTQPETFHQLDLAVQQEVQQTVERQGSIKQALDAMKEHYNHRMTSLYGQEINDQLSIEEKELLLSLKEYTGRKITVDSEGEHLFTTPEKESIIEAIHDAFYHDDATKTNTPEYIKFRKLIVNNSSVEHLFFAECLDTHDLSDEAKGKIQDLLEEYERQEEKRINPFTYRNPSSFSTIVQAMRYSVSRALHQVEYDEQEKIHEMRKAEGRKTDDRGMSL